MSRSGTAAIDAITTGRRGDVDVDVDERWPINPIRVKGHLDVELLGLRLARVRLDLVIAAVDRFLDFIDMASGRDGDDPPSLAELSRSELYRLARDADVEGRSGMTRAELIDALAD